MTYRPGGSLPGTPTYGQGYSAANKPGNLTSSAGPWQPNYITPQAAQPQQQQASQQPQPGQQQGGHNIETSITPGQLYSGQDIRNRRNMGMALGHNQANLPYLSNMLARPGMSARQGATMQRALPAYAQGMSQANLAREQTPLIDMLSNASFNLQGQTARENQAMGQAQTAFGLEDAQRRNNWGQMTNMLNFGLGIA